MSAPIEASVEQIKTACGYVPVSGAEMGPIRLLDGSDGPIVFTFALERPGEGGALSPGTSGSSLLSLAACVTHPDGAVAVEKKKMHALASRLGPLFGSSQIEPIADWAAACALADLAVSLQQIANKARDLSLATSLFNLEKQHNRNPSNGDEYDFFYIARDVQASYLDRFGGRRVEERDNLGTWSTVFVRHVQEGGRHIYVFLILSAGADEATGQLELAAISLGHMMTRADYEEVRILVSMPDDKGDAGSTADGDARAAAVSPLSSDVWLDVNGGSGDSSPDDDVSSFSLTNLDGDEAELVEKDRAVLGVMVQALISAHLVKDAHVDPFQTDKLTGYITFDTLLSWIWFDFSKCLGAAKIGYCSECGTPFSLVGHRGIPREFCSRECKTKAKNRRMKVLRENVRQDFLAGSTLNEIATLRMKGEEPDRAVVRAREMLQNWPELKHLVEAEVREQGMQSQLLRRCVEEELAPKVLSKRARKLVHDAAYGPFFG